MDEEWRLRDLVRTEAGEVACGVYGEGPPVVLVHGTPSRSLIWRGVARRLAGRYAVHVYDLPGFGGSERYEGQDVSIAAQGRGLGGTGGGGGVGRAAGRGRGEDLGGARSIKKT